MEITEVYEPDLKEPFDAVESAWSGPDNEAVMIDPFGLPFEPMDEFSDAPLEFEELTETLWNILNDTYVISVKYNRHSPYYLKLCSHLEKDIKQLGSLCVTKAVLEQKDLSFPKLEGLTVKELYAMVSLHFRKCSQAFQDDREAGKGYDMEMLDWICRWALLAERLKATEDKIQKIRSGKINSDRLLERAQVFKNEPRGQRPARDPQMIRKTASLPIVRSFASETVRKHRQAERERLREERAREKEKKKTGHDMGFGAAKPFPAIPINTESIRKLLLEDAKDHGDTDAILKIQHEDPDALAKRLHELSEAARSERSSGGGIKKRPVPPSRNGPSDDVRKKLREQRKKKKRM